MSKRKTRLKKQKKLWKTRRKRPKTGEFFFSYSRRGLAKAFYPFMSHIYAQEAVFLPSRIYRVDVEMNISDPAGRYGVLFSQNINLRGVLPSTGALFQDEYHQMRVTQPSMRDLVFFIGYKFPQKGDWYDRSLPEHFESASLAAFRQVVASEETVPKLLKDIGLRVNQVREYSYSSLARHLPLRNMANNGPHSDKVFGIRQKLYVSEYLPPIGLMD